MVADNVIVREPLAPKKIPPPTFDGLTIVFNQNTANPLFTGS